MDLIEKIQADVKRLVRPVGPDELSLSEGGSGQLQVGISVAHTVTFAVETSSGQGPLPADAIRCISKETVEMSVGDELAGAKRTAGSQMDEWAERMGTDYRAVLSSRDCMDDPSKFGVEENCTDCGGEGTIVCEKCHGDKRVECSACGGSGQAECPQCHGTAKMNCGACHGVGHHTKGAQELDPYEKQRTSNQKGPYVQVPCTTCGGSGKVRCVACVGGKVQCTTCHGSGKVTCSGCEGKGRVSCKTCGGTGKLHHLSWISCTVGRSVEVDVEGGETEDVDTFRKRVPVERIADLASGTGGVRARRWNREDLMLTGRYEASIPVEWAEARIGPETLIVRGYGPDNDIFQYQGLMGRLLEHDLRELEQSVKSSGLFRRGSKASLVKSVQRFLDSEVNVQIVESGPRKAPKKRKRGDEKAPHTSRLNEVVSEHYLHRAGPAIYRAVSKLQQAFLSPWLLTAFAIAFVLLYTGRHGVVTATGPLKVVVVLAGAFVLWAISEIWVRTRLKAFLGKELRKRLKPTLRKRFWRYRFLFLAGFVLAWYASLMAFRVELHFREKTPVSWRPVDGAAWWR